MRIYLGADHRGFRLKEVLKSWLVEHGYDVIDLGASFLVPDDDYVDYATSVVTSIHRLASDAQSARGILICGSGIGVDIVANRYKRIRCGLGISPDQIREAREDDDINVLALAAEYTDVETAKTMVKALLETEFSGKERYIRRIKKIDE